MNKRALVMRRQTVRAISMILLLAGVLSFEALTLSSVCRGVSIVSQPQQITVDPSQFFQSLSQP